MTFVIHWGTVGFVTKRSTNRKPYTSSPNDPDTKVWKTEAAARKWLSLKDPTWAASCGIQQVLLPLTFDVGDMFGYEGRPLRFLVVDKSEKMLLVFDTLNSKLKTVWLSKEEHRGYRISTSKVNQGTTLTAETFVVWISPETSLQNF